MAKRVIVVTPSSLTNNWAAEVQKWLGSERCKALVMQPGPGADSQVGFIELARGLTTTVSVLLLPLQSVLHVTYVL